MKPDVVAECSLLCLDAGVPAATVGPGLAPASPKRWRAPEERGFSPAAKRAPTHSTICAQGVGMARLKPRPSEAP